MFCVPPACKKRGAQLNIRQEPTMQYKKLHLYIKLVLFKEIQKNEITKVVDVGGKNAKYLIYLPLVNV